tara:strand:+ start:966 stop:1886 length:921 start_codon:yes stop_codon:yes gene_type:complete
MKWDRLRLFFIVSQSKSLTEASSLLSISQSALSRQMQALEQEMGSRLFIRKSRGIELTPAGLKVAEASKTLSKSIDEVNNKLISDYNEPSGKLRVYATNAFGSIWLAPKMTQFMEKFPQMQLSLSLRDAEPRVTPGHAHAEIRMTPVKSQDYIQIKLSTFQYKIFASNSYLKKYGLPQNEKDLDNHKIVSYGQDAQPPLDRKRLNWLLWLGRENNPRTPIMEVSSIYAIARCVESGLGIASLPSWMEKDMRNLFEILNTLNGPSLELSLCFHEQLRNDPRIIALKQFLQLHTKLDFSDQNTVKSSN